MGKKWNETTCQRVETWVCVKLGTRALGFKHCIACIRFHRKAGVGDVRSSLGEFSNSGECRKDLPHLWTSLKMWSWLAFDCPLSWTFLHLCGKHMYKASRTGRLHLFQRSGGLSAHPPLFEGPREEGHTQPCGSSSKRDQLWKKVGCPEWCISNWYLQWE